MGHHGSKHHEADEAGAHHHGDTKHGGTTAANLCSCDCPEPHCHTKIPTPVGSPVPAPLPAPVTTVSKPVKENANKPSKPLTAQEIAELHKKEQKVLGEMTDLLQHQGRREDYHMGPVLGKGHFAVVRKCTCKKTGQEYAVKILSIDTLISQESLIAELKILRQVKPHPNVVNLIDYFYSDHHFYVVMDLCLGGDLFAQITKHGKFTEHRAAVIATQVADAIMHIHACGVIHRDIKPENVLLVSNAVDSPVKVADFGLSKIVNSEVSVMKTICGTWAYAAPEVILGKPYTSKVDNWSFGVLLYTLISGYLPFDPYADLPQQEMLRRVAHCVYDFNDPIWKPVSKSGKSFAPRAYLRAPSDCSLLLSNGTHLILDQAGSQRTTGLSFGPTMLMDD